MTSIPYATATSGAAARDEITKLLRRMGCDKIGFMDDYEEKRVLLQFFHKGKPIRFEASAAGWAQWSLRVSPWNSRMRRSKAEYEADALEQGLIAVNSILRDWVKGQIAAVESGLMSVETAFLAHMVTNDGRTVVERFDGKLLLPAPEKKV